MDAELLTQEFMDRPQVLRRVTPRQDRHCRCRGPAGHVPGRPRQDQEDGEKGALGLGRWRFAAGVDEDGRKI